MSRAERQISPEAKTALLRFLDDIANGKKGEGDSLELPGWSLTEGRLLWSVLARIHALPYWPNLESLDPL
jgi:hypothetical protein